MSQENLERVIIFALSVDATLIMDTTNFEQQLGDCLGKGAFGSVYRALNWGTGETVAIKQVRLVDLPKGEIRVIMVCFMLSKLCLPF